MRSAEPVLRILRDLYSPTSVVEIGCGSGTWLATAEHLGFTVLHGYDAPWADAETVRHGSTNVKFTAVDLETAELKHDRRYDLAMSVEVAEHVSEHRADFFVDTMCDASDVVLFGAAIPHQGGVHHVHEMPQTYWIEKFRARGYEPFDIIRPAIWGNEKIAWWYRQNTLVYVKKGAGVLDPEKLRLMEGRLWNSVHPQLLARRMKQLEQLRAEVDSARSERDDLRRHVAQLEGKISIMRPPSRLSLHAVRHLKPRDLPQPVRPAAVAVWRHLPGRARSFLRAAR